MDQNKPEVTEEEFLRTYDKYKYEPFAVTVDIVLLTVRQGRFSVLLVQRGDHPFKGSWALPGGSSSSRSLLPNSSAASRART